LSGGCASAREGRLKIGLQDKILPHHWPVLAVQAASHLSYARGSLAAAALLHLAHKSGYCGPVGIFPMDHGEVIAIMNGDRVGLRPPDLLRFERGRRGREFVPLYFQVPTA